MTKSEWIRRQRHCECVFGFIDIYLGPLYSSSCVVVVADFPQTFRMDVSHNRGTCSYGMWTNNRRHTYCTHPFFTLVVCVCVPTSKQNRFFGNFFFGAKDFKWQIGIEIDFVGRGLDFRKNENYSLDCWRDFMFSFGWTCLRWVQRNASWPFIDIWMERERS